MTAPSYNDDFEPDDFEEDFKDDFEPELESTETLNNPERERNIFGVPKPNLAGELGQFGLGALSSATFGASEQLTPEMLFKPLSYVTPESFQEDHRQLFKNKEKVFKEDPNVSGYTTGQLVGSLPYLEGVGVPVVNAFKLAFAKSPIFPQAAAAVGRLAGWGTVGAIEASAKDLAKGEYPDPAHIAQHAATYSILDGALQGLGKSFNFVKSLFQKADSTKEPVFKVLEKTINELSNESFEKPQDLVQRAFNILEENGQRLKPATRDVKVTNLNPIDARAKSEAPIASVGEPTQPKNEGFRAKLLSEPAEKPAIELPESKLSEEVSEFAPRYEDKKSFGEGLTETLESNFAKEKEVYDNLYKQTRDDLQQAFLTPRNSAKKVADAVKDIQKFKTKPAGYEKFEKDAVKFLEDAGYTIQRDLGTGKITDIIGPARGSSTLSASDAVELSRRISEFVDYEAVEPSIKKVWGAVAKSLKEEAKAALGKSNPKALELFEKAERAYENTAKRFGTDSVKSARYTELPSDTAKMLTHPDKLEQLKNVLEPGQYKIVEREVLEALHESNDPAKLFREVKKQLSPKAQKLGEKIVKQHTLDKELSKINSIDKLKQVIKNPEIRALIEERGGKGTVEFLTKLPEYQKKIELFDKIVTNNPEKFKKSVGDFYKTRKSSFGRQPTKVEKGTAETFERLGKTKETEYGEQRLQRIKKSRHPLREGIQGLFEEFGLKENKASKLASNLLGIPKVGTDVFTAWWWNPRLRRSFEKAMKSSRDPLTFYEATRKFAKDVGEEEDVNR